MFEDFEAMVQEVCGPEWQTDGFGIDCLLICPCGITIEQDGTCPNGCVSPLREAGLI